MLARTRYLTHNNKLTIMAEDVKFKECLNGLFFDIVKHNFVIKEK
jgi:hypothetical protein